VQDLKQPGCVYRHYKV